MMPEFKRGEIYYVAPSYSETGSEMWSGRPAVIVSNDQNNRFSSTVEVCYMTTRPKSDLPTHVVVHATGKQSTVLCEQISSVDKSRLGDGGSVCSAKEMALIDEALRISLGLPAFEQADSVDAVAAGLQALRKDPTPLVLADPDDTDLRLELARAEASLEVYKTLCADLMDRIGTKTRAARSRASA